MFFKIIVAGLMMLPAFVYAATDSTNLPVPPSGFNSVKSGISHGTVTASLNYSTRNYGNRKVTIYTPPGYSSTGTTKYPVVYLMHGIGGNEVSWIGQGSNEGHAQNDLDFLYSQNKAKPMIVVMPDGNVKTASDQFGAFGDVLLNDLIPWVEKTYPVATDPDSRALSGLSMGGGQTFNIGFPNTDKFHYLGPYSAAPDTKPPSQTITDYTKIAKDLKLIYISYGSTDGLMPYGQAYHDSLDKHNVFHFWQIEQGLGHEMTVWDRSFYNFAQRIFLGTSTGNEPMLIAPVSELQAAKKITVFDLSGKIMKSIDSWENHSWQNGLIPGTYIIQWNAGKPCSRMVLTGNRQ